MKYESLIVIVTKDKGQCKKTIRYKIRDTDLAQSWARALHEDYLVDEDVMMAKTFCLHGWGDSNVRTKAWLCDELTWHIARVNEYLDDNGIDYRVNMQFHADTVDQTQLNTIHRHFELLKARDDWATADGAYKWSVNQFNHMCHELEGHLYREATPEPNTGTMIVCLYPNKKHKLTESQLSEFRMENYKPGDVRLHYAQTGRQYIESYLAGDTALPVEEIQPLSYLTGEFDMMFHSIDVDWQGFRDWLTANNVDINDPNNALGYATVATCDPPDDIFEYNDISFIGLVGRTPEGTLKRVARKLFHYTSEHQYYWERTRWYGSNEPVLNRAFINSVKDSPAGLTQSKTIVESQNSFHKTLVKQNIIADGNCEYYIRKYGSVEAGVRETVNIINGLESNIISHYSYKPNYYLEFTTRRIVQEHALHSQALLEQFDNIREYVEWFKHNVWLRKNALGEHNFTDFHEGNVFVTYDLRWICVDFDDVIRFNVDGSSESRFWDIVRDKFFSQSNVSLAPNYVSRMYPREQLLGIWNSV